MTCQWCIHYRRRGGKSLCLSPERADGHGAADIENGTCRLFSPRRTCTSCDHRCSGEERDRLRFANETCPRWKLRELSSWGGDRRSRINNKKGNEQ